MTKKSFLAAIVGLIGLAGFALVGCGGDDQPHSSGLVAEVVDSVSATVADHLDSSRRLPTTDTPTVDLAYREPVAGVTSIAPFNDLLVKVPYIYAVYDGGLVVYDLAGQTHTVTPVDDNLRALTLHASTVMAGGRQLYEVDGTELVPVEGDFSGEINDLCSFGARLMIGTSNGLYARDVLGTKVLLESVPVSALTPENEEALWVGTDGHGLYRWDGADFNRRYLRRDTTLFDYVTALAFNHGHLYLGTDEAMYVYNGGNWATVGFEEGLPDGTVRTIDATDWVVYVGTNNGLYSYFSDEVKPVDRFEADNITALAVSGRRIFASGGQAGLVMKQGPSFRVLLDAPQRSDSTLAAISMLQ